MYVSICAQKVGIYDEIYTYCLCYLIDCPGAGNEGREIGFEIGNRIAQVGVVGDRQIIFFNKSERKSAYKHWKMKEINITYSSADNFP
jgi:hypothetical protein